MENNMDMAYKSGIMEIDTKDILRMGKGKDKENIISPMVVDMRVSG
jgi:hypothetical protein